MLNRVVNKKVFRAKVSLFNSLAALISIVFPWESPDECLPKRALKTRRRKPENAGYTRMKYIVREACLFVYLNSEHDEIETFYARRANITTRTIDRPEQRILVV